MTTIEKIRSKIQEALDAEGDSESAKAQALALFWVLEIIDKYAEQEPMDHDSVSRGYLLGLANKDGAYGYISAHEIVNAPSLNRQEPSEDAVSRQAVLDLIEHYNSDGLGSVFYGYEQGVKFANAVNKLPSVRPQEPKTGHWIKYPRNSGIVVCNQCKGIRRDCRVGYTNYCNHCGAKMVQTEESEGA